MTDNKYNYGREIIFNLRSCQAISPEVYLHWIDKIDNEEQLTTPDVVVTNRMNRVDASLKLKKPCAHAVGCITRI